MRGGGQLQGLNSDDMLILRDLGCGADTRSAYVRRQAVPGAVAAFGSDAYNSGQRMLLAVPAQVDADAGVPRLGQQPGQVGQAGCLQRVRVRLGRWSGSAQRADCEAQPG